MRYKSIAMKIFISISSFVLLMIMAGCSPMKISVSDGLRTQTDEYQVSGRQGLLIREKLRFGAYRTTRVKRSWTKGSSSRSGIGWGTPGREDWVNIISTEYINRKQTVHFNLTDEMNTSDVFCVSRFRSKDLQIGKRENSILNIGMDIAGIGGRSESFYYIQIFINSEDSPWQLILDNQAAQAKAKTYTGILAKNRNEWYALVPITRLEKNGKSGNILGGSVGFEFRDKNGVAVAAVSLIDKGMVFLRRTDPQERFILANACTAVLLRQQID